MHAHSITLAIALAACSPSAWANTANVDIYGIVNSGLPTHETYAAAAELGTNFFTGEPYIPQSSISTTPGVTASIPQDAGIGIPIGNNYTASANTTLGSNHAFAQASSLPLGSIGIGSFSGWYDKATITGGTGTGTAQFTVQLTGAVDVGTIAGVLGYGLVTSSVHPSVLGRDIIVNPGTPTSPWYLAATEVNPVIGYGIVASPYNDATAISGLFGAPPTLNDGILGIPANPAPPVFQPDLALTPGAGQIVSVTLTGTLNFTYGEAFYLISTLKADLLDLAAFQPFCSFDVECPVNPPIDGIGATTLDFSNSANLVNIALPQGATASFASGETYNVTSVPEPAEYLMLLAGLGLVGWRARRRN